MNEEINIDDFICQECEVCGGNIYVCYCLEEEFGNE